MALSIVESNGSAFHWRYGVEFARAANGDVVLCTPVDERLARSFVIPAAEWASIIAHVSAGGETSEKYAEATAFHGEAPVNSHARDVIGEAFPGLVELERYPIPGYEHYCDRVTDVLRAIATVALEAQEAPK